MTSPIDNGKSHATAHPRDIPEPLYGVLESAIKDRATDIHVDPTTQGENVRFRVDGIIHVKNILPEGEAIRLVNQVKVAANLNVHRNFNPVESEIELQGGWTNINLRVTVLPVGAGEAAHLRLLNAESEKRDIHSLGFIDANMQPVTAALQRNYGLILVAGGTGTGKTTTLYALANSLDLKSNVVVSIEDPVEFHFPDIRQLELDELHGVDMPTGLRILLRMDPDAILIGEIRDRHSANTAARAALAGKLVIATLHATDAATAVDALKHYAVPRYVLSGALTLVITQELLRSICRECARPRAPSQSEREAFELNGITVPDKVLEAATCPQCANYGYRGRTGIFEVTPITSAITDEIAQGSTQSRFRKAVLAETPQTMKANALWKAAQGLVSIEEAMHLARIIHEKG